VVNRFRGTLRRGKRYKKVSGEKLAKISLDFILRMLNILLQKIISNFFHLFSVILIFKEMMNLSENDDADKTF